MRNDGRMDAQTDLTKLIVAFCKFATAPYNENSYNNICYIALKYKLNELTESQEVNIFSCSQTYFMFMFMGPCIILIVE